ncbi:bifunctional glycosyltransferase family 2 protein/CDP-glycerol:glycerophosphate glycerophosphotransferase [Actinocorallia longicatena]|uniref:Glycosyltransferase 2-like domain-containing protein n=1 Tax=Actinocorallia longicatena TaxID=111803 RepID=A0ABP6QM13_9ACTN
MARTVQLSVIAITHDTGEFLAESLESVARQTHRDLEVLVVDNGAGVDVPMPDERFRVVRGGALSRGAARNLGVQEARGEFLAFLDDGDLLPPDSLERLLGSVQASGSDFAAGNVSKITELGRNWRSWYHRDAFAKDLTGTHIRRHRLLFHDRYITGKVFRRSFWDRAGLSFPDGSYLEDLAVAIPAHFRAKAVDVLSTMVLRRRNSTDIEPTTDPQDVADGYGAIAYVTDGLEGTWRAVDRRRFELTVLDRELKGFLDAMPDAEPDERIQIIEASGAFAEKIDAKVLGTLPALSRLKWHLAQRRMTMELVKVVRYERGRTSPSIIRNPVRRYVVYPYWKDEKVGVPEEIYRARGEVRLRSRTSSIEWRDGRLVVKGETYINSVSMRRRWTSTKGFLLRNGSRRIPVRAKQTKVKKAWTGFEFSLNPSRLKRFGRWQDGVWDVDAGVFNAGVYRHALLKGGSSGTGSNPPYSYVTDDVRVVPQIIEGKLRITVETVRARVTSLLWRDGVLELTGRVAEGTPKSMVMINGEFRVPLDLTANGSDFTVRINPSELPPIPISPGRLDDTEAWRAEVDGVRLVVGEEVGETAELSGTRELTAGKNASGYFKFGLRTARFVISGVAWAEGKVAVTGTHPVYADGTLVLRSRGRRLEYPRPLVDGTAELPVTSVPTMAGLLPLRPGRWDVLFQPAGDPDAPALAAALGSAVELPAPIEADLRGYSLEIQGSRLVVSVTGDLTAEEQSSATRLRQEARARVQENGLRDAVLFSCFNGKQYSDSTRAIHEELVRRGSTLEQLWVVNDAQVELPPTVKAVRLNGEDWHEAVASSRYIVTNHRLGDWFQRHPDQVVVQTWHGTPLKKIGKDVKEVHFAYAPGMKSALQSAGPKTPPLPEWTHLLSPNRFSSKILKRAFGFTGELIEAGYPRNDVLYSADADAIAKSVRERVGIPAGKKVVLYAPTWRDDQFYGRGRYKADWRLDLDAFAAELGDDHVLLARLHPNVVDGAPAHPLVHDVSTYPDIAELYLVADLIVSDYSSVMFDYANLRRPMLFFTYDLPHYRDKLRGFYFDFEKEAPGPLVETSAELIAAIRDIDAVSARYTAAYDAFYDRFCSLEDGKAASRVVDQVFKL